MELGQVLPVCTLCGLHTGAPTVGAGLVGRTYAEQDFAIGLKILNVQLMPSICIQGKLRLPETKAR